jgi:peroxiredoxin
MKDFLGNELNVGDDVVIMQKSYRNFIKGKIIRITKCMVIVQHDETNVCSTETKQTFDQVIKIV